MILKPIRLEYKQIKEDLIKLTGEFLLNGNWSSLRFILKSSPKQITKIAKIKLFEKKVISDFNADGKVNDNMVTDPTGQDPDVGDDWAFLARKAQTLGAVIEPWRRTCGTRNPPHGWVHMEWRP